MADEQDIDLGMTVRGFAPGQKVFERYVLVRLLGRGGMGVVWLARDEQLNREIALKFLPEMVAADPTSIDDLKRETTRSLELTHPHIVRVYDFITDGALAAIAMEFVAGRTLAELRLQQATRIFETSDLAEWTRDLCGALAYAHADAQVVHRDLKPSNLMVDARRRLKVTDFGIAASVSDTVTRVTKVTSSGGTPAYASPQQIMGEAPSPADDIYSLGATLFELLTSKPPFYTGNLLLQVQTRRPPTLAARRTELRITGAPIPPAWEEVIAACLEKDPAQRPSTVSEVALRLTNQATRSTPAAVATPPPLEVDDATVIMPRVETPIPAPPPVSPPPVPKKMVPVAPRRGARPLIWFGALAALAAAIALTVLQPWVPRGAPTSEGDHPGNDSTKTEATSNPKFPTPTAAIPVFTLSADPPDAPNLRMWIGPHADQRPPNGVLRVADLPDGDYEVNVQADGYQSVVTRVHVTASARAHTVALVPLRGRLEIATSPGAAATAIDGAGTEIRLGIADAQGRLTNDNLLRTGRYTVRLTADGRIAAEASVELTLAQPAKLALPLAPLPGELRVNSVPEGASVSLNGHAAGITPVLIREVPSEQAVPLVATLAGYRSFRQEVTLQPRETRTISLGPLVAAQGAVLLRIAPQDIGIGDVKFFVDGAPSRGDAPIAGRSDPRFSGLAVGAHTLAAVHPDYERWSQSVNVGDDRETTVDVTLVAKTGTVAFSTTPPGARVALEPLGKMPASMNSGGTTADVDVTPFRRPLPPGSYLARFTLDGFEEAEETVEVAANQTTQLKVRLVELVEPPPPGAEDDFIEFDHPRGLIAFSYPSSWQPLAPAAQFGIMFSFGDPSSQAVAQVYEVPGAGNPDMAMNMIAQAVGPYGVQFAAHGSYRQGYAVRYEGTTASQTGTSQWVGIVQAVPGGVVGIIVGSPTWNFAGSRAVFDRVIQTVEFQ